jgi:hypothetical protein
MRGCTCSGTGMGLCPWCTALAQRAGVLAPVVPDVSEKAFMQAVRREALACGWLFYHTFDSRRSAPGFVDAVLAKPGKPLLMCELKVPGGVVTLAQQRWLNVLQQGAGVEAHLWYPEDWSEIVERLRG